jgi:hypothetical protein
VSGTVYADGKPRIVDIKGIRVDAEFGKSMIYEDKPGATNVNIATSRASSAVLG